MTQRVVIRQGGIRQDLTIAIVPDEATDGSPLFRAEIPDLPGCMSHGETPDEALQNLEEAYELYAEVLTEQGRGMSTGVVTSTSGTTLGGGAIISPKQWAGADTTIEELIYSEH